MAPLPAIASLWIGDRLSWFEQLCLTSFVDAGHDVTLFAYGRVENVPPGVRLASAADIYPETPMLRHVRTGSPAIHADMWRLHLLKSTDLIWVDADVYCWRPLRFERSEVFGWEKPGLVCNAVLGLPSASPALDLLLDLFADPFLIAPWLKPWQQRELSAARNAGRPVHMTEQDWGFTGPASLTWALTQTGEIDHAEPETAFYPIPFKDRNHMIRRRFRIEERLTDRTRAVHLWARRMKPRLEEKEGNRPRRGSFLDKAIRRHGICPEEAPIPPKRPPRDLSAGAAGGA